MAKLGTKSFRRNSKRRISKKNTKKSKSRRRFRKFRGGFVEEAVIVPDLTVRKNNMTILLRTGNIEDRKNYDFAKKWGSAFDKIGEIFQQTGKPQDVIIREQTIRIINNLNNLKYEPDDIALVIYGDESEDSQKKIQDVISPNVMSTM
jgi:hypothetical protein